MVVVAYTGGFGDCNDGGEAGGSDDVMRVTGMVCVDGGRDGVAVGMVMMALVVEVWRGDEMVAARVVGWWFRLAMAAAVAGDAGDGAENSPEKERGEGGG
ncbi:hypothetical protein Tco_0696175 [Tanacetum coccineum]